MDECSPAERMVPLERTEDIDLSEFEEEFQIINNGIFGTIHSHYICQQSSRVVINTERGFAIVSNSKITRYYETGPFMGKAGVRISCLQSNRNLIALVPDRNVVIHSQAVGTLQLQMCCVYVFDINVNCMIYQKSFNHPITRIHINGSYIFAGNSKRIIALNYREDIKANKKSTIDELIKEEEGKKKYEFLKFLETECTCLNLAECRCGLIKSSLQEPQIVAYVKSTKRSLRIFITELDFYYDYATQLYEDFCLSPSGQYLALVGLGGIAIKIIDVSERKLFTQFKRGYNLKPTLCLGFFGDWFGIVSQSKRYATFHLFQVRRRQQNQTINSKFKRYFSTYSLGVDLLRQGDKLMLVCLIGGCYQVLDLRTAKDAYGEHVKTIKHNEIEMWE